MVSLSAFLYQGSANSALNLLREYKVVIMPRPFSACLQVLVRCLAVTYLYWAHMGCETNVNQLNWLLDVCLASISKRSIKKGGDPSLTYIDRVSSGIKIISYIMYKAEPFYFRVNGIHF